MAVTGPDRLPHRFQQLLGDEPESGELLRECLIALGRLAPLAQKVQTVSLPERLLEPNEIRTLILTEPVPDLAEAAKR